MSASILRVNLGGEGEVSDAINVPPGKIGGRRDLAETNARQIAQQSGQPVIMAAGNRLPFADGSVDEVWTNNVPIDHPVFGYFGPSFTTAEILRVLKPGVGCWLGTSAP